MVFVNLVVTLLMIFHPREFFSFIFSEYIEHLWESGKCASIYNCNVLCLRSFLTATWMSSGFHSISIHLVFVEVR